MSTFSDKLWGTPKQSAYFGWFFALLGGVMVGAGVVVMVLTRWFQEFLTAHNFVGNPGDFATVQLYGAIFIFLGIFVAIIGIFAINHSQKKIVSQSLPSQTPVSIEKKFCRFCGTENKKEAVFCEKCGKQISET